MSASGGRGARRMLDDAGGLRAMTGVLAVMLFLTVLAAAIGLGAAGAARLLDRQLAGRMTVQIAEGDAAMREAAQARVVTVLRATPAVARVRPVPRAELARLLRPWLGDDSAAAGLPLPALIDVELADPGDGTVARVTRAVRRAAPTAQVDRRERWMSPVGRLMRTVTLTAALLVLLMAGATAAVVVLAARAALETHRATLEVVHILGATDIQVARLFQRRVALDAALGGGAGTLGALAAVALLGTQLRTLGSELLGGAALTAGDWMALALLPLVFVGVATLAARLTVFAALRQLP